MMLMSESINAQKSCPVKIAVDTNNKVQFNFRAIEMLIQRAL